MLSYSHKEGGKENEQKREAVQKNRRTAEGDRSFPYRDRRSDSRHHRNLQIDSERVGSHPPSLSLFAQIHYATYSIHPAHLRNLFDKHWCQRDQGLFQKGEMIMANAQTLASKKYHESKGIVKKSYTLNKALVAEFKEACELAGVSQSAEISLLMKSFISQVKRENSESAK